MKFEIVSVPSFWGTDLKQKLISVQERNNKLVVLFPGRNYSCELPLLYYAGNVALQHNYDLFILEYGYQAARTGFDMNDLSRVIDECYDSIKSKVDSYDEIIFISKSMGTIVAGEVYKRLQIKAKHIYLTPLVETIPFINASEGIVIYGGNDPYFTRENAIEIENKQRVFEIPNADHGLESGNIDENLTILMKVIDFYKGELQLIKE
ncbi:alpha/beta hydrolase [Paenibacillus glycanilyticus]|uniref:alpha/beta hydrolase n=1 Tax=Paenibacillus glycanilyticus TaxID=126569 RepID=UPI000FDAB26D|nr:alpha/beta hydrolase [Paenibacillus glycanilyticus]